MKYYAIITISIMVLAFTLPNAYAQNETRTFDNCFNENAIYLTLGFLFVPFEKLSIVDTHDPSWKTLIINMCNFYHEKTGIWVAPIDDKDIMRLYQQEFFNKYFDTYPEKLKQMITQGVLQKEIIK